VLIAVATCVYLELSSRRGAPPVAWRACRPRSKCVPVHAVVFRFLQARPIFAAGIAKLDALLIFLAETVGTLFLLGLA
jgi:hypothetical protein